MPLHHQVLVPGFDFECDAEIAEFISLLNTCGIGTVNSCQDNDGGRGTTRRIWVEIPAPDLPYLLGILDQPGEAADRESLSNRIAPEHEPADWQAFRASRAWHYTTHVNRYRGHILPLAVSIRFPATDLPDVITRLRGTRHLTGGRGWAEHVLRDVQLVGEIVLDPAHPGYPNLPPSARAGHLTAEEIRARGFTAASESAREDSG